MASSHRWRLYSASAAAAPSADPFRRHDCRARSVERTRFCRMKVIGGVDAGMRADVQVAACVVKPGAWATNAQAPDFRPIIEKRPLSSVVAVASLARRRHRGSRR